MKNCPASQGDEPRRGGGGLTPTGTTPDTSTDNINGSKKRKIPMAALAVANLLIGTVAEFIKTFAGQCQKIHRLKKTLFQKASNLSHTSETRMTRFAIDKFGSSDIWSDNPI